MVGVGVLTTSGFTVLFVGSNQLMLANATRICEAKFGTLYLRDGDGFHVY